MSNILEVRQVDYTPSRWRDFMNFNRIWWRNVVGTGRCMKYDIIPRRDSLTGLKISTWCPYISFFDVAKKVLTLIIPSGNINMDLDLANVYKKMELVCGILIWGNSFNGPFIHAEHICLVSICSQSSSALQGLFSVLRNNDYYNYTIKLKLQNFQKKHQSN